MKDKKCVIQSPRQEEHWIKLRNNLSYFSINMCFSLLVEHLREAVLILPWKDGFDGKQQHMFCLEILPIISDFGIRIVISIKYVKMASVSWIYKVHFRNIKVHFCFVQCEEYDKTV